MDKRITHLTGRAMEDEIRDLKALIKCLEEKNIKLTNTLHEKSNNDSFTGNASRTDNRQAGCKNRKSLP